MKIKILIITVLLIIPFSVFAFFTFPGGSGAVVESGGCSSSPTLDNSTTDYSNRFYSEGLVNILSGGKLTSALSNNVCRIDIYLTGAGDVDAISWDLEHWTGGSSSDMGSLSSTLVSAKSGADMPDDGVSAWVTFEFTAVTISVGDAIILTRSDGSSSLSNYLIQNYDYITGDSNFMYIVSSGSNGSTYYTESTAHANNVRVYETE